MNNQKQVRTESEWVEKIRSGDTSAFEKLFYSYCQPLINFAYRYVQDTPVAENIVQDIFLKIWSSRTKLDPSLNIKTYLFTSVKNRALKHLRHVRIEQGSVVDLQLSVDPVKTPENGWKERELTVSVQQAIKDLPEKCRTIFSMNRFDQLTYAEIADILNLSIKTIETQMGRALQFLRKRLSHFL